MVQEGEDGGGARVGAWGAEFGFCIEFVGGAAHRVSCNWMWVLGKGGSRAIPRY